MGRSGARAVATSVIHAIEQIERIIRAWVSRVSH